MNAKLALFVMLVLGCSSNAPPLPKGPPPEYEEEPTLGDAGVVPTEAAAE